MKRQKERVGDLALEIECLADLNETIDALFVELEKTGNAALLEELCPYFGTVWPSARALAETVFERRDQFVGKNVLELGCGLAIPSLVAAKLGANVIATDFHPEVPRFLEENLRLNEVSGIRYQAIDWSKGFPGLGPLDWVIGSDVLYESQHALLLAKVVRHYVQGSSRALIADPARPYLQSFVDEIAELGLRSQHSVRTAFDQPKPKDVFIVELCNPK